MADGRARIGFTGRAVALVVVLAALAAGCSAGTGSRPSAASSTGQNSRTGATAPGIASSGADGSHAAYSVPLAQGRVVTERIPGGSTGFAARPATVYLPPILRLHPTLKLPLLVLLHGTPGGPGDWDAKGGAAGVLNRFAAAHGGRAPVVVMPDINGSEDADTECVRGRDGADVEDYLRDVVPAFALAHLPVTPDRARWAVAGASEGGTCALVLALRSYPGYRVFGDFSGLRRLTVGPADDPSDTIDELFGGSVSAYDHHDPQYLFARHRYPHLAGWFECGRSDTVVRHDQAGVAAAAARAGVDVRATVIAGGHDWAVWTAALTQLLPWMWTRIAS